MSDAYSTVTNQDGKAGIHYHFASDVEGESKIQVGVLGDAAVTPVTFTMISYYPVVEVRCPGASGPLYNWDNVTCRINDLTEIIVEAWDRKSITGTRLIGNGIYDAEIRQCVGTGTADNFVPAPAAAFLIPSEAFSRPRAYLVGRVAGTYKYRITLPGFAKFRQIISLNGQVEIQDLSEPITYIIKQVTIVGNRAVRYMNPDPNAPRERFWLTTNMPSPVIGGTAQVGVSDLELALPVQLDIAPFIDWNKQNFQSKERPGAILLNRNNEYKHSVFTVSSTYYKTFNPATNEWANLVDITTTNNASVNIRCKWTEIERLSAGLISPVTSYFESIYLSYNDQQQPVTTTITSTRVTYTEGSFIIAPPEMRVVAKNTQDEYVKIPCIQTKDPTDTSTGKDFYVEILAPANLTTAPTLQIETMNACGNVVTDYDGAQGSLKLENVAMQMVDTSNGRYTKYRTSNPLNAVIAVDPDIIPTGTQNRMYMSPYGSIFPQVSFGFGNGARIQVRRAVVQQRGPSGRELIYPSDVSISMTLLGYTNVDIKQYKWDCANVFSITTTSPTISYIFSAPSDRRKDFIVSVTVALKDGTELSPITETIRVASAFDLGNPLPPITQTSLDTYLWTNTFPITFDNYAGAPFNTVRLALETKPNVGFLGRTVVMKEFWPPKIYGAWIHTNAWNWKKNELDGVVEHEKRHILDWDERKVTSTNISYRLWKYLYDHWNTGNGSSPNLDWLMGFYDHAHIYYDYQLSSTNFSYLFLRQLNHGAVWVKNFNHAYRGLINGEPIDYSMLDEEERPALVAGRQLFAQINKNDSNYAALIPDIKKEMQDLYKRATTHFPELDDVQYYENDIWYGLESPYP